MAQRATVNGAENFLLDLSPSNLLVTPERCLVSAALPEALRVAGGTASLGVLLGLADLGACEPAIVACDPDWTATQDMSLHGAGWYDKGPAVLDHRLLRVGKKVVVVRVDAYDAQGEQELQALPEAIDAGRLPHTGRGIVTFARLPRTAARAEDAAGFTPRDWVGMLRERTGGWRSELPLVERIGARVLDPARGVLEMDHSPYVANSIGTVTGAVQAVLLQLAAEVVRPGRAAVDAQLHFLAQLRTGPVHTAVEVLRDSDDHSVVEVRLVDAGADDHLLTIGTITLRTP